MSERGTSRVGPRVGVSFSSSAGPAAASPLLPPGKIGSEISAVWTPSSVASQSRVNVSATWSSQSSAPPSEQSMNANMFPAPNVNFKTVKESLTTAADAKKNPKAFGSPYDVIATRLSTTFIDKRATLKNLVRSVIDGKLLPEQIGALEHPIHAAVLLYAELRSRAGSDVLRTKYLTRLATDCEKQAVFLLQDAFQDRHLQYNDDDLLDGSGERSPLSRARTETATFDFADSMVDQKQEALHEMEVQGNKILEDLLLHDKVFGKNLLELAMEAEAKKFIGSILVQKCVMWLFHGGEYNLISGRLRQGIAFMLTPRGRFFQEVVTYLFFVVMYCMVLAHRDVDGVYFFEYPFYVTGLAYLFQEVGQAAREGKRYFKTLTNWFDVCICLCLFVSFGFRIYGLVFADTVNATDEGYAGSKGTQLTYITPSKTVQAISFDVLSLASVAIWARVLHFTSVYSPSLGTMTQVIRKSVIAAIQFLFIFVLLFLGFGLSIWSLSNSVISSYADKGFGEMIFILYSAVFGGFDFSDLYSIHPIFGRPLLAIFLAVVALILLNLLIAVLNVTFKNISKAAQDEFKFFRTLTVYELHSVTYVAVPFNLVQVAFFWIGLNRSESLAFLVQLIVTLPIALLISIVIAMRRLFSRVDFFFTEVGDQYVHKRSGKMIGWFEKMDSKKNYITIKLKKFIVQGTEVRKTREPLRV